MKFETYEDCLDYLYNTLPAYQKIGEKALKTGLGGIQELMSALGDIHHGQHYIHIAGSNGKGSTSHMLSAIFQAAGYRVGLYSSPHLKDFTERFKINGVPIEKSEVIKFTNTYVEIIEKLKPSFFELTVAMAFYFFKAENTDINIIETGLGGRLDSTNIILPALSVITNISLEHTHILGDTIEKIAFEKAGIIKRETPVIIGKTPEESLVVFREVAARKSADLHDANALFSITKTLKKGLSQRFEVLDNHSGKTYNIEIDNIADYQAENTLTSFAAAKVYQSLDNNLSLSDADILTGLKTFQSRSGFLGRMQILDHQPLTIADCAHNPAGIAYLAQELMSYGRKIHFVMGFSADKDVQSIFKLLPPNSKYYLCPFDLPRSMTIENLKEIAIKLNIDADICLNSKSALMKAKENCLENEIICITGSIFLVAELI